MTMKSGVIPPKDACYQCYHPPVFYGISALIGNVAVRAGATLPQLMKLLQSVSCVYGILTVGVCYLIVRKFPLSDFSMLISFGTVCFLPRHIYMSAMHSNDTISYLFVALAIYIAVVVIERGFPPLDAGVLSVILTIAEFTKYTALVVLPVAVTALFSAVRHRLIVSRKRAVCLALGMLALPLTTLAGYMLSNVRHYDSPLPSNVAIYDSTAHRPRDAGGISFFTFKPWEDMRTPMLAPGKLHSFWTLIYSGMWFDTEPYFLRFLDADTGWWKHYYRWYRGEEGYPGENPSLSHFTSLAGFGLIGMGLVPLVLILLGFVCCVTGRWSGVKQATVSQRISMSMFPVLAVFNAAGVIALTMKLPVYNSMKASYFLNSTPAFMVFLGLGVMRCERNATVKRIVAVTFGGLFTLATLHILHIVLAI